MSDPAPDVEVAEAVHRTAEDIGSMEIRGAATIAAAAARALGAQADASEADTPAAFRAELRAAARVLYDTRPTAVSLPNALRYVFRDVEGRTVGELRESVEASVAEFCDRLDTARHGRRGYARGSRERR